VSARLLRVREAASYLSIGVKAIYKLINCGQLPYIQLKPGTNSPLLVDVRDLDRLIESWKTCAGT
jgi:excisionase family DNA binding protein